MQPLDLALDLICQGRLQESLASFELALHPDPQDFDVRKHYAEALAQLEMWPQALALMDQSHADSPAEICQLALQFRKFGYVRRSRRCLEAGLRRFPSDPLLKRELGRLFQSQGLWETALNYYDECQHQGLRALMLGPSPR